MKPRGVAEVARGQIALFVFTALCVALHPGLVLKRNEGGLSNYGIHIKTVVPYSLAFLGAAWFSLRATSSLCLDDQAGRGFRRILRLFAVSLLVILLSTYLYKINRAFDDVHVLINIAAGVFETISTAWMFHVFRKERYVLMWSGVELVGFVLGLLTVAIVVHLVFVSELVTAIGFGMALVTCARSMTTE